MTRRHLSLAAFVLLAGATLPACDLAFRSDCGPDLDGTSAQEVDQVLDVTWTYWYWADTAVDQIGDYVEYYNTETCHDGEDDCHGRGPVCVCTLVDEETVEDCLVVEDMDEAYEYRLEREAEVGAEG